MFTFLFLVLVGCFLGTITGLTPGLHVNTVCLISLTLVPTLGVDFYQFAVAMVAMSVTHTFLDFIPAIFLGVPEEETALSILPTHQLFLKGDALKAVKLTAIGSLIGLATSIVFLVPAVYIIPKLYSMIRPFITTIIFLVTFFLIKREGKKAGYAVVVFFLSGFLGITILNMNMLSGSQVLFPAFTGLFGISTILLSLNQDNTLTPQKPFARVDLDKKSWGSAILGSFGGILVGVLPSLSPSQVGVIMAEIYGANINRFLLAVSAINTSDAVYSLVSLYTIGNPRSGVAVMLSKVIDLDSNTLILLVASMSISAIIAYTLHMAIGKKAVTLFSKINYKKTSKAVIIFMSLLVIKLTGLLGLYILLLSTLIGLMPPKKGIARTHLMGILILPTMLYFMGVSF